jgi:2-aminoadipate transaminase
MTNNSDEQPEVAPSGLDGHAACTARSWQPGSATYPGEPEQRIPMPENSPFAARMDGVPRSFIREILKATADPAVISFAGGLPNPHSFPVEAISAAAVAVLRDHGAAALQYSTTEGYPPLREIVAGWYEERFGLATDPDSILITNGSQQALDLIGKVLLDEGDRVLLERPGYLGAIQAFSLYRPQFIQVPLDDEGMDPHAAAAALDAGPCKLVYTVPNFQNPSGISYSKTRRAELATLLSHRETVLVEDDPYGSIRFRGEDLPPLGAAPGVRSLSLGSFSKIVAPALRLGWIRADRATLDRLVVAKQASDLHTNSFSQRIVHRFLADNPLAEHLERVRSLYATQCNSMLKAIERHFPAGIRHTRPDGGMFLWVTLAEGISSTKLFEAAAARGVLFVPGTPFFTDGGGDDCLRLNFSSSDEVTIEEGIRRLGETISALTNRNRHPAAMH